MDGWMKCMSLSVMLRACFLHLLFDRFNWVDGWMQERATTSALLFSIGACRFIYIILHFLSFILFYRKRKRDFNVLTRLNAGGS